RIALDMTGAGATRHLLFWRTLRRDANGASSILLATSLMTLAGAATMAIDLGSVYLAQRKLQGAADAAALAAAAGDVDASGYDAAQRMIAEYTLEDVSIVSLTP